MDAARLRSPAFVVALQSGSDVRVEAGLVAAIRSHASCSQIGECRNLGGQRVKRGLILLVVAMFVLAACSDDDSNDSATAETNFCDSISELETTVTAAIDAVQNLDVESTTVDDVKSGATEIRNALESAESAGDELAQALVDDVRTAFDNYASTVDSISDDASLSDVATDLEAAANEVDEAWVALFEGADC